MDEGKAVAFLDFSKVFDTVPHIIFLDKLSSCWMSRFIMLDEELVEGQAQRVVVKGAADWSPVVFLRAQF